jgi:hypothetical protein
MAEYAYEELYKRPPSEAQKLAMMLDHNAKLRHQESVSMMKTILKQQKDIFSKISIIHNSLESKVDASAERVLNRMDFNHNVVKERLKLIYINE